MNHILIASRRDLSLFALLLICQLVIGQDSLKNSTKNRRLVVLPALYFSPETSLAFGGVGILYFRTSKDSAARPSSVQNVFAYTLENQILFTNPYNIFIKDDTYWLNGELSFFVYPYEYYGIGTELSEREFYKANFFRLEINALKKVRKHLYLGPALLYDEYFKVSSDENGGLRTNNVLGIEAGRLIGLGASFTLDKRDNVFSPQDGFFLSSRVVAYENVLIGDYSFTDIYADFRKYIAISGPWESAFQVYHQSILGEPPFYNYAQMGGSNLMRGYFKGAYRDSHFSVVQTEIRRYVFKNIVASAFGGFGSVGDKFLGYDKLLGSYGVGLRYELDKKEHLRIRVDYARGFQSSGFYLNINEAF